MEDRIRNLENFALISAEIHRLMEESQRRMEESQRQESRVGWRNPSDSVMR